VGNSHKYGSQCDGNTIDSDVGKVAFLVVTQMSADELRQKVQNDLMDIKEVRVFPYFIQNSISQTKDGETGVRDKDNSKRRQNGDRGKKGCTYCKN